MYFSLLRPSVHEQCQRGDAPPYSKKQEGIKIVHEKKTNVKLFWDVKIYFVVSYGLFSFFWWNQKINLHQLTFLCVYKAIFRKLIALEPVPSLGKICGEVFASAACNNVHPSQVSFYFYRKFEAPSCVFSVSLKK